MEAFFQRPELVELLHLLDNPDPDRRGVLLLGDPGVGKSVLLQQLEAALDSRLRVAYLVSLRDVDVYDLPARVMSEMMHATRNPYDVHVTLLRESGGGSLQQTTATLNQIAEMLNLPVLLFDGLDESGYPQRTAAAIEELSQGLHGWKLVLASRLTDIEVRRFHDWDVLRLGPLSEEDMVALLRQSAPFLREDVVRDIVKRAEGNPLLARLDSAQATQHGETAGVESANSLEDLAEARIDAALSSSPDRALAGLVLEELALAGGQDWIPMLAGKLRIAENEVRTALDHPSVASLLTVDEQAGTVAFAHASIQEAVLSQQVFVRPFQLAELRFGAEEAERDDLLDESYVGRHSLERILVHERTIVIGDRGSGKSAIFRKLAEEQSIEALPVDDVTDLLHRIVDKDTPPDADALRAAWLVAIAATAASAIPAKAPNALRRNASGLRAALGLPTEPPGLTRQTMHLLARLLGGTTLKFGVGPVDFEAKLPVGARPNSGFLDVDSLLQETDALLEQTDRHVVVLLDRIDEAFKYDRGRQEALVQALLQAEARVIQLARITLVVFLRTDLFELYDIQEKNKLVSRSLVLEWSEEDWLQVLIRRVGP
ncbi:P-loop ATPase, Sll1717 family [Streptomyces sp. R33]|uniref:AAA+ ATPase domain-containing protein n=1 Tax=Streptomyces sp. R33 TaxID=3238629 RepID=A0AB39XVC0_9ACTN